jgi:sugar lactone lactonase YvrE
MSSVLFLLGAAAGCGHVAPGGSSRYGVGTVVQTSAQDSATLPGGYGPITILAGDPSGRGVWFWDSTKTDLSVFRVDSHGSVTSWPVLSGAENNFQAISGFTVTAAGIAWLGINSTLTRVDSASGTARTWQIPAPADNPAAESYLPADLKNQHLVQGIAVAPDGEHVAIAMNHASSVGLFDMSSGTFSQIAMPATSDDPVAVAYSPDGTLGIALANYTTHREDSALIIKQGGSPTVVRVADSSSLISDGTNGFIFGSSRPSLVTTVGKATPIVAPAVSLSSVQTGPAINVMPNGELAAITSAGIVEFPGDASSVASATSASITLQLPGEQCQPNAPSYVVRTTTTGQCHPGANAMAVDGEGDVWVVPGTGGARVERLGS